MVLNLVSLVTSVIRAVFWPVHLVWSHQAPRQMNRGGPHPQNAPLPTSYSRGQQVSAVQVKPHSPDLKRLTLEAVDSEIVLI